ncbi:hypothetical protein AAL_06689 [Moelleriella libera RCEF 2490]|uniref:Uncharacterized protein n=1 Tax=Moelleriella libera RCEF 2490 TaxID=1081109 RepID=A0A162ICE8_9HYPO|nr:hypothetical protein AAL_06689 [Moelleriella libera RCEF 2490]
MSIISPLDEEWLTPLRFLVRSSDSTTLAVHKSFLTSPTDEEEPLIRDEFVENLSNLTTPEVASYFERIPDKLVSLETLLYVGFSPSRAASLWQQWQHRPASGLVTLPWEPEFGMDLLDFVLEHLNHGPLSAVGDEEISTWPLLVRIAGIVGDVHAAIIQARLDFRALIKPWRRFGVTLPITETRAAAVYIFSDLETSRQASPTCLNVTKVILYVQFMTLKNGMTRSYARAERIQKLEPHERIRPQTT